MNGEDLEKPLGGIGYVMTRQTGSHARLTCVTPKGGATSRYRCIRTSVSARMSSILSDVAGFFDKSKNELASELF
jgi:hypothetical protein